MTVTKTSKTSANKNDILSEFNDLEKMFDDVFNLLDTFQSTARMKMLMMMSKGPVEIAVMRKRVNPKLVYENIEFMQERRLIEEEEGSFNLTIVGRKILMEYLRFLEDIQKTIWEM